MHIEINADLVLLKEKIIAAERTEHGDHGGLNKEPDEVHILVECGDGSEEYDVECSFDKLKVALLASTVV